MRAKIRNGNQLILPEEVALALHGIEYVGIEVKKDRLILAPVSNTAADAVREKLAEMGITEQDVADAIACARRGDSPVASGS